MIPLSILDLAFITQDSTPAVALRNSLDLAQHAESWGYNRYWLAEHHNMTGIASAATSVVIALIAGGTKAIRVGAGGIMLPNHAPLVIAEQFGTLASVYPGRIDLGLGRAPGSDQRTARALRRDMITADTFSQDVMELQAYFEPALPGQAIQAVPGAGLKVPLWILGSSLFGAQLAAALGLPYSFASHFAPDALLQAIEIYREQFKPSAQLRQPYVMPCINVIAAPTDDEAQFLFTSIQQQFTNLRRGVPGQLQAPLQDMNSYWSPPEEQNVNHAMRYAVVGSPDTVERGIEDFIKLTDADELMIAGAMYDHSARLRSYETVAKIVGKI